MSASAKVARSGQTLVVRVPLPVHRRGARKLVVSSDGAPLTTSRVLVDSTILKALARAHCWKAMLESGEYVSMTELARAEDINLSYLCRILRLTLLAPGIVEALLDGKHTSGLQLADVLCPFSLLWADQLKKLGM